MARHRARRRIGKDVLALAVRKDFNAAIVFESELITSFLYAVQNQGKHRERFGNQSTELFKLLQTKASVCDSSRRRQNRMPSGAVMTLDWNGQRVGTNYEVKVAWRNGTS